MTRLLPVDCSNDSLRLLGLVAAASTTIAGMTIVPVQAASLTSWQFNSAANQLELNVKDGTTPRYFLMAQPARIVVDLPNTSIGTVTTQKTYTGAIRQIRVSQFQPGLTRIVMELSPDVSLAPGQVKLEKVSSDSRWLLRPLISQASASSSLVEKPASAAKPFTAAAPVAIAPVRLSLPPLIENSAANSAATSKPALSAAPNNGSDLSSKAPLVEPVVNPPAKPSLAVTTPSLPAPAPLNTPNASSKDPFPSIPNPNQTPGASVKPPTPPVSRPTSITAANSKSPPPSTSDAAGPDAGMAVDTTRGVAIAVPAPDQKPAPSAPIASPASSAPVASAPVASPASSAPVASPAAPSRSANSPASGANIATKLMGSAPSPSLSDAAQAELPTTIASARSITEPMITVPPLGSSEAQPAASPAIASTPTPAFSSAPAAAPAVSRSFPQSGSNSAVDAPSALPSTADGADQPVTVSVPAISPNQSAPSGRTTLAADSSATPLPPDLPDSASGNVPAVQPPMPTSAVVEPVRPNLEVAKPLPSPEQQRVVDFGQRLPSRNALQGFGSDRPSNLQSYRSLSPDTLLPAGTLLDLRYPGEQVLNLAATGPQQEVLVLQTGIRDSTGNVVAPEGTRVIGRFETSSSGSRFVAQAISLGGRTLPLVAQSESLEGNRSLSENTLVRNAGIGVLAGGLLGGLTGGENTGWGILGGAAAGAAATYFTAPKPAAIQPGQVFQIRLQQDLRQP
jgi:hypothetical protein